jgi:hypothetical protein
MTSGALQFLGNLFEYFLVRKNQGKQGKGARADPGFPYTASIRLTMQ